MIEKHQLVSSCIYPDQNQTHNPLVYWMTLQPTKPPTRTIYQLLEFTAQSLKIWFSSKTITLQGTKGLLNATDKGPLPVIFPDHIIELDTGDQLLNFLKLSTFDAIAPLPPSSVKNLVVGWQKLGYLPHSSHFNSSWQFCLFL